MLWDCKVDSYYIWQKTWYTLQDFLCLIDWIPIQNKKYIPHEYIQSIVSTYWTPFVNPIDIHALHPQLTQSQYINLLYQ